MSKSGKRDLFDVSGKVAVITGGAGLLALEFAEVLAEYGANIVLVDLDENSCKNRAIDLERETGNEAIGLFVDLTKKDSIEDMVRKTTDKFKKIDITSCGYNNIISCCNCSIVCSSKIPWSSCTYDYITTCTTINT